MAGHSRRNPKIIAAPHKLLVIASCIFFFRSRSAAGSTEPFEETSVRASSTTPTFSPSRVVVVVRPFPTCACAAGSYLGSFERGLDFRSSEAFRFREPRPGEMGTGSESGRDGANGVVVLIGRTEALPEVGEGVGSGMGVGVGSGRLGGSVGSTAGGMAEPLGSS